MADCALQIVFYNVCDNCYDGKAQLNKYDLSAHLKAG